MNLGIWFAWAVAIMQYFASAGYFYASDWKRGILWALWATGNICTIYIGK